MAFTATGQVDAQATYTVEGFANNFGLVPPNSPVGVGEAYTAIFDIDTSVLDTDSSSGKGEYLGAITSSSIVFSGGYESTVNFTGGSVVVQQDNEGAGIFLQSVPVGNNEIGDGIITLFQSEPFDSDALLTEPQEIVALGNSLWSLTEADGGLIVSASLSDDFAALSKSIGKAETGNGPITLNVSATAVPEPTSLSLLGLGVVIASVRRRRK